LPAFSGLWFRILVFALGYAALVSFLIPYAKRIERDPSRSLVFELDQGRRAAYHKYDQQTTEFHTPKVKRAACIFGASLALIFLYICVSLGVSTLSDYTMPVMAVLLTVGGLTAGKIASNTGEHLGKDFLRGMLNIAPSALLIAMAMSVKHIIVAGGVMDTILYRAYTLIQGISPYWAVLAVFAFILILEFFISGAAAKAVLVMPLIVPLADMIGLTRQVVVEAFCFGDGFTNVFLPTSALLLIVLGIVGVPYSKWFKWIWKVQLLLLALCGTLLLLAVSIGYC